MAAVATKQAIGIRSLILNTLQKHQNRPVRPTELLEELQSRDVTVAKLKDELAALIDSHEVEFSSDRRIRLREKQAAAS